MTNIVEHPAIFAPRLGNIAAELAENCRRQGWWDAPAYLSGNARYTHGEVHDRAARFAGLLASLGVEPGDRVMLALPDCVELVWGSLGAMRRGCVAVLVNPMMTETDHQMMALDCDPALVLCRPGHEGRFSGRTVLAADHLAVELDRHLPLEPEPRGPREPAYAQYTSGTTGKPKAVLHGHGAPLVYRNSFLASVTQLRAGEITYSANKMCYSYGLNNSLFAPLLTGCTAVLNSEPPDPAHVAELLTRHQVDVFSSVPGFYRRLVFEGHAAALRGIRLAVTAAEPLPAAVADLYARACSAPMLNHIGSTEAGQPFASNTVAEFRAGTVGRVLPSFEVRIVDERGDVLPAGDVGLLQIRGPATTLGYLGRPELNSALYDGDWMRSNDLGYMDEDGFLHLVGRADDVEICEGMNVYPLEVEEALYLHPEVAQAAVCSVTSDTIVNELRAFVVPRTGEGSSALELELINLVGEHHAGYKTPRRVVFVGDLPRNANGKVDRAKLRTGAWGG